MIQVRTCDVMWEGDRMIALATILERDGRHFLKFTVADGVRRSLVWPFRKWVKQQVRPLYTVCASHTFKTAPRLCLAVGFAPTCEKIDDQFVWVLE